MNAIRNVSSLAIVRAFRGGLALAGACGFALTAAGGPHSISRVNLQPVDAQSIIATPEDPTVAPADILFDREPRAVPRRPRGAR